MFRDSVQFLSAARQSASSQRSPRRMALAVSLGLLIGLIPKGSLLAWLFVVLMMISTAHLLVAFLTSFAISWVAVLLDGFTHRLGAIVLTDPRLEPTWSKLYDLPVVPWTQFNNTVVMGSLLVGLALFLPVYLVSESCFRKYGPIVSHSIYKRFGQTWIYRWLCPIDEQDEIQRPIETQPQPESIPSPAVAAIETNTLQTNSITAEDWDRRAAS